MLKVILKKKHRKDCTAVKQVKIKKWESSWDLEPIGVDWLDKTGRLNNSNCYRWMEFKCNDPDCPARGIVMVESIESLIEKEIGG